MARKPKQASDRPGIKFPKPITPAETIEAEPGKDQPATQAETATATRDARTTSQQEAPEKDKTLGEAIRFTVKEKRPLKETTQKRYAQVDRRKRKEQSEQTTLVLMLLVDGMVSAAFGPECAMNDAEREMIAQPLTRIMARMSPATSELLDKYTDPVMLLFGVIMWGSRIALTLREKEQVNKAQAQPEPAQQEPAQDTSAGATPLRMVAPDLAGFAPEVGNL